MKIHGRVVEIGDLQSHASPTPGIVIETGADVIEVAGIPRSVLANWPTNLLGKRVTLTIECTSAALAA